MIDLEFIEKLIRTLDESGLDHVEIERGGTRVRISRSPPVDSGEGAAESSSTASDLALPDAPGGDFGEEAVESEDLEGGGENLTEITSPMVGTFYRAASPDSGPFTEVGKAISTGDVLCIIEAMKLMNELKAEAGGIIQEVCVPDGEPVEYGQVLFRVRPS